MTGMGKYSKDPLDLARGQMDFARMASDAPTSKQILFKAQTIIPAVPAKPVWQKAAPAAGAALAAGLLFVPVIPQGSSLERLDVNFEGSLTREHAQQMQFEIRNALPSDILMGSSFSAGSTADAGQLSLSFSAAGEPQLSSTVERVVMDKAGENGPLFGRLDRAAELHSRDSIVSRAVAMFGGSGDAPQYVDPGNQTAREILRNPELLEQGLGKVLEEQGYAIGGLEFLDRPAADTADSGDLRVIELDCWPRAIRFTVDAPDLARFEHNDLRNACAVWLDSMNLGASRPGLAQMPSRLLPIVVEVVGPDGRTDRHLTERLQAMIQQPDAQQITDTSSWKPQLVVKQAVSELMQDGRDYAVSYEQVDDPAYNRDVNFYWATVYLSNSTEQEPVLDERTKDLEQQIDF